MDAFTFQSPATSIVFGVGRAAQLDQQAQLLGMRRALFVVDPGLAHGAAAQAAQTALQSAAIAVEVFSDVVPDPTDVSVEAAAQRARAFGADGIVALGGGSAMDTAKAAGILVGSGDAQIAPYYVGGAKLPQRMPPIICLPTTAGTGAEVTYVAIVTETATGRKLLVRHPLLAPAVALIDPALTATLPRALTAYTGMDALSHAVEALTSTLASPMSDTLALDAIPRIRSALPRALADGSDLDARAAMSYAALVAGQAFLNGRVHLGHAVGHSLGAAYHLPHGLVCIVCMPAILRFIAPAAEAQIAQVARCFDVAPAEAPAALEAFMRQCSIPPLGEVLRRDTSIIPELIAHVQGEQRLIGLSRRQPTAAEWAMIFAQSF